MTPQIQRTGPQKLPINELPELPANIDQSGPGLFQPIRRRRFPPSLISIVGGCGNLRCAGSPLLWSGRPP